MDDLQNKYGRKIIGDIFQHDFMFAKRICDTFELTKLDFSASGQMPLNTLVRGCTQTHSSKFRDVDIIDWVVVARRSKYHPVPSLVYKSTTGHSGRLKTNSFFVEPSYILAFPACPGAFPCVLPPPPPAKKNIGTRSSYGANTGGAGRCPPTARTHLRMLRSRWGI